jgi:hypothetical protein
MLVTVQSAEDRRVRREYRILGLLLTVFIAFFALLLDDQIS